MKLIKNKTLLVFMGVFFLSSTVFSQKKSTIKKADDMYENYAYVNATEVYEKVANKGYINQEILQKLGDSYFFRADYVNALKWYEKLFEKEEYSKVEPEYYYRYALCLKSVERYTESNKVMNRFSELVGKNERKVPLFKEDKDYLADIQKNSNRVNISTTGINTENSEYGPAFFKNTIVFTANRKAGMFDLVSAWTNKGMYNIYTSEKSGDSISNEKKINSGINTSLNESTAAFTKDGKVIYFTRNDISNKKKKEILLKIYRAELANNGDWKNIQELPFCSSNYNTSHPALSPDEKYLYFASNMPGTYGKSDIFRVEIRSDGTYGKPENLGKNINTEARDTFPFVSADNVLYFASDGYPGLGGLDIYASKIESDGTIGLCQNVGRPINSPYDDFSLIFNSQTKVGYFASNRPGGKGSDDIYSFHENSPLFFKCTKKVKGVVKDAITGEILSNVSLSLRDRLLNEKASLTNTNNGIFNFEKGLVFCDDDYFYIRATKEGYIAKEDKVFFNSSNEETVSCEILLTPEKRKVTTGDDLTKVLEIKDIYFDFDKTDIHPKAEVQLSQLVEVMNQNPTMVIEVKSHTDSRGTYEYNDKLSQGRAKSTIDWIISQGISPKRISGKGYGERMLLNNCTDGVDCTEEEHAVNRRSEFIIVKL